jgi:membrane protein YqaA with SNARE-associated domain|tara:strand:- start:185 stop:760 length:576 start_codon:yes stop_codon:yes gene_type:complete
VRKLYKNLLSAAKHRHANKYLAVVAFSESSFFPIPPDVMLIPMVLAKPNDWWRIALTCTLFSVIGGIAAYFVGFFLFQLVALPLLEFYNYQDKILEFNEMYHNWGGWVVFLAGLTPFPYKIITIASGMTQLNLALFIALSVLSRGLRFFAVSVLLYHFGDRIRALLEKYFGLITLLAGSGVLLIYVWLKFI